MPFPWSYTCGPGRCGGTRWRDWLADELWKQYKVQPELARPWIHTKQVLPLLDGLDEVAPEHRAACVEAINTFRREHPLVPMAVCSRAAEYEDLGIRMELTGAVMIQPLSRSQIRAYLKQAGKPLARVRWVLRNDETLWELTGDAADGQHRRAGLPGSLGGGSAGGWLP